MNNLEGNNKFNYQLISGVPFNVDRDHRWVFFTFADANQEPCSKIMVYTKSAISNGLAIISSTRITKLYCHDFIEF